ncbi:MAG: septation protein SpoVG family protein [Defluviitaleaceae bacterium]|nr:septation protein SpoVG family protein [Defluviitaleaceae bacterium]
MTQHQIDVKLIPIPEPQGKVQAFANITINNLIAINGVRVMDGPKGSFVAMPQSKGSDGKYYDIAFPATAELRKEVNKAVLDAHHAHLGISSPKQEQPEGQINTNKGVSEDRIQEARSVDILDYLHTHEPHNLVKHSADTYKLKGHDSLKIFPSNTGGYAWHWHSRGQGGKYALDFVTSVRGYGFVDAVKLLTANYIDKEMAKISKNQETAPPPKELPLQAAPNVWKFDDDIPPKGPIVLPKSHWSNAVVSEYLTEKRAIDPDIVNHCISKGAIYQSKSHNNAVFVGFNQDGKIEYASIRGTTDKKFMMEAENSNKATPFVIPIQKEYKDTSRVIFVTESPIDALSKASLDKQDPKNGHLWNCVHRISLGGVSPKGLHAYLEQHPQITKIVLNFDADKAGRAGADRIAEQLMAKYPDKFEIEYRPPQPDPKGRPVKDFNDVLVNKRNDVRAKGHEKGGSADKGEHGVDTKDSHHHSTPPPEPVER